MTSWINVWKSKCKWNFNELVPKYQEHEIEIFKITKLNNINPLEELANKVKIHMYYEEACSTINGYIITEASILQPKLRTNELSESECCLEPYLTMNLWKEKKIYKDISRFRTSCQCHEIETGRHLIETCMWNVRIMR